MISLAAAALAIIVIISPGGDEPANPGPAGPGSGPTTSSSPAGPAALPALGSCTSRAASAQALTQALSSAGPGSRICVSGDLSSSRLEITKGGAAGRPVAVTGAGTTVVKGITVKANNVVVDGFQVLGAQAPGIEISGNGITVSNNYVKHPTGGDFDGLRFFGSNLKILHNTITDISPDGGGAHADCMQTFTSGGGPPSEHVVINGNRCDKIDNQCLMAEGPGDVGDGGGGPGKSGDWLVSNNVCEFGASQALMIEAIQNVTIRNNLFSGKGDKAIGLDINSTGATVSANKLLGIKAAVGMSEDSKQGYQGPQPRGGP